MKMKMKLNAAQRLHAAMVSTEEAKELLTQLVTNSVLLRGGKLRHTGVYPHVELYFREGMFDMVASELRRLGWVAGWKNYMGKPTRAGFITRKDGSWPLFIMTGTHDNCIIQATEVDHKSDLSKVDY